MKPSFFLHLTFIFLLIVCIANSVNALEATELPDIIDYYTSIGNYVEKTFFR